MSLKFTDVDPLLTALQGVFWVVTYILVVRQAFRDRTYAMPVLAMSMNVMWEFLFAFVYPSVASGKQQELFNIIWFGLDLVILYTYLRFWRSDYPKHLPTSLMWPWLLLTFAASAPMYITIVKKFGVFDGEAYTAFGDNLVMSVLFITMLIRRGDRRGQSLWIAWAKLFGTAFASLDQYLWDVSHHHGASNPVWNALYIEILFFDLLYVVMLAKAPRYKPESSNNL